MDNQGISIQPMAPAWQAAWLDFFDHVAFADNPRWAGCYCQFPTADHQAIDWKDCSAADNRARACTRIGAGHQHGVVAVDEGGRVVGWCHAGPRADVTIWDDEGDPAGASRLGAITCFVVAPGWRGRGMSQALLRGACDQLAAEGFEAVQAWARPGETSPTANHAGSFTLYQRAGFTVWRDGVDGGVLLRLRLQRPGAPAP
ncbi:GNAT family N-acetyltransferase [Ideonella sp.]|uniref:GNAT family N-acetyltransferase n=1 Tax=Ideonella sp. TaxID=1929293 RepID=UPI002B4866DC|nr:GNAT family N-acetyltransferase [Ideonella sp.]HJV71048.1 GNAT family N-acetyltransferase [Ideonella sp.]